MMTPADNIGASDGSI